MARVAKTKQGTLVNAVELTNDQKIAKILSVLKEGLEPPEKLGLSDWSDANRELPRETSSEPGQWRTSRFPFLKRIMDCLSPYSQASEVVAIKGAQLGFTEICINWILYISDMIPGPTMYVQKTEDAAKDFSTQKLEPNIKICKKIKYVLGENKPKNLSNETLNKGFPGGFIVMGGSNSGAFLRSKSIANGMADEEDSFKANIDGEGSPIGMIRKRMSNFPFSKFFRLSTPKFTETSTIEPAYSLGSMEQVYVPCPHCNPHADRGGTYWVIEWKNIKWSDELDSSGIPEEIWLICAQCGSEIPEHHKTWMLDNHIWMSEKGSPGKPYEVGDVELPSFQISSLYSPLGFFGWRDAVKEWFAYVQSKDKALLQVFINQTLGESFSAAGQDVSSQWLYERKEKYEAQVPEKVLVLTAGVDVQGDRLELEITGWGLNLESWSIDYQVLYGTTDDLGDENGNDYLGNPTVWKRLDEYLLANYLRPDGTPMRVECCLVDGQYLTEIVNNFCYYRAHRHIYVSHGKDGWGYGLIKRPKRPHEKYGTLNFTVYADETKTRIYGMLKIDKPGPGYCHFPDYDHYTPSHFRQLTSENMVVKNGKRQWVLPSGARNEQLDCRSLTFAALQIYSPNLDERFRELVPNMIEMTVSKEDASKPLYPENLLLNNNPRIARKVIKKKKPRKKSSRGVW